ncbi:MAG: sigma-54-dependent Fis family transcriptional regulator [Saprospiraceae bacterium]|nr:sigma-54-dependent Fis family transcriptional regulator [Saprospiraceae bacterium]
MNKILVIDDDHDICALLKRFLERKGYEVKIAFTGKSGIEVVSDFLPDVVLCDFRLGDMDGHQVISEILSKHSHIPILVMTGYSDIRTAVNVMKLGALDYITKPIVPDEILLSIRKAFESSSDKVSKRAPEIPDEVSEDKKSSKSKAYKSGFGGTYVVGESSAAKELYRLIDLVAPTSFSVLIYGESGAGKESVARMIHEKSPRKNKPFVSMDCGAISRDLANSELFGHEKGSFTGAISSKIGHFELANGGTLFFDEIANLPYDVQVSLLRVIQERKLKRIGGTQEIPIDVRIVVASNEILANACAKGKFREDLYHRFNEFSIDLPPLRDRKEDILVFARLFLQETAEELQKTISGFSSEVEQILIQYPWFGNVRELKNVIKRATLLTEGQLVQVQALPFEIAFHGRLVMEDEHEEPVVKVKQQTSPASAAPSDEHIPAPLSNQPIPEHTDLKTAAQKAEYHRIMQALQQVKYNKSKTAAILGIDRKTLYNKLKLYNIT